MTSHPKDATKEMLDVMANSPKICKHLHLPFQSGSNRVLKPNESPLYAGDLFGIGGSMQKR